MDNRATSHGPPAASSIDGDYFGGGGGSRDREVDIGQLFSDVSKTVGKFKNIFNTPQQAPGGGLYDSEMVNDRDDGGSPLSKLFGSGSGVCFKTCGMEDIQFAARRAGEMFITMKTKNKKQAAKSKKIITFLSVKFESEP
uniref:Uncharacterized protein n=1 Tax=Panagrolaimus sp. JU765 TaxID=591449 RepID=A0AC34QQT7_9BILA